MKNYYFFILVFFVSFSTSSQNNQEIDSVYAKYFNFSREVPYLHLNKTKFFKGEELWFKAYVLDLNSQKLHKKTTNLYCTLFDENGNQKEQKMLFVKNGLASGSFKIDTSFIAKNYYLKAHTNYMKNFSEDESFLQKIEIIENSKESKNEAIKNTLDFQILAEGGHLISNSKNTIGIVLKDSNGKGLKSNGTVMDNLNNVISKFKTNIFGLGKTTFPINAENKYFVNIETENGIKKTKELVDIKNTGVTISVENPYTNFIKIHIRTNKNTLKTIAGEEYFVLIHNTNSYFKRTFKFKSDANNYTFLINNNRFKLGTNIITLFNSKNKPIAERVFFNYKKSLFQDITVNHSEEKDSIKISFNKKEIDTSFINLSASILPINTKSYTTKSNIYSKFLLKPFIKGDIENPRYYFSNLNRKKMYDLDLLLLTQGWSKYKWGSIFNNAPKENFVVENGVSIKGSLNMNKLKDSTKITLLSNDNKILITKTLKNKKFSFNNLFIKNNSTISFSLIENNKFLKPKIYTQIFPTIKNNSIKLPKEFAITESNELTANFIYEKNNLLDEVEVKAAPKFTNKPLLFGNKSSYKIDSTYSPNTRILDFITSKGFKVEETVRRITVFNRRELAGSTRPKPPRIFLNDFMIYSNNINQLNTIRYTRLEEYDEVFVTKTLNGEIYLYTKKDFYRKKTNQFIDIKVNNGFAVEKEYYQPNYISTTNKTFENYGAIFWAPNITINKNEISNSIKFNTLYQKEFKILIEGITDDGKLISTEKIITLE